MILLVIVSKKLILPTDFGCSESDIITGSRYTVIQGAFTQFSSFYTSVITCDSGYLLNGTNTSSVSVTCEKSEREGVYTWQGRLKYQCECEYRKL